MDGSMETLPAKTQRLNLFPNRLITFLYSGVLKICTNQIRGTLTRDSFTHLLRPNFSQNTRDFFCLLTCFFLLFCQFGALLDENAGSKFDSIGLNAMSNADKAGRKLNMWPLNPTTWWQSADVSLTPCSKYDKLRSLQNVLIQFAGFQRGKLTEQQQQQL